MSWIMRIVDVQHINILGRELTTLAFDDRVPLTQWRAVEIDGVAFVPVFQSNLPDNMLTFSGSIEPKQLEAMFVS